MMTCTGFAFIVAWLTCGQPAAVPHASFCDVARPIIWSRTDARLTKEQVDSHNRVGKQLCGWGKK